MKRNDTPSPAWTDIDNLLWEELMDKEERKLREEADKFAKEILWEIKQINQQLQQMENRMRRLCKLTGWDEEYIFGTIQPVSRVP